MFQALKPRDEVEASGMGLAVVKKFVESAGGTISVERTKKNRGATFKFLWPREWQTPDQALTDGALS